MALLHEIRRDPSYQNVPAVACTAYVRSVERERFLDAGFEGYVSKPFTRKGLLNTMERVLGAVTGVVTTYRDAKTQAAQTPSKVQESSTEHLPAKRIESGRVLVNGRMLRRLT